MGVENQAQIVAIMGSSGSGKSTYIKQQIKLAKPKRLIIFDPKSEYGAFAHMHRDCLSIAKDLRHASFKTGFRFPTREEIAAGAKQLTPADMLKAFEFCCKAAYQKGDCWIVIDELSLVTKPTNAPAAWSDVTMRGRHEGLTVIAASQRPASVDKNFFGNASIVRTGRLNFDADIKTLANVLNVSYADVRNLAPLHFIQRDMNSGQVTNGVLKV